MALEPIRRSLRKNEPNNRKEVRHVVALNIERYVLTFQFQRFGHVAVNFRLELSHDEIELHRIGLCRASEIFVGTAIERYSQWEFLIAALGFKLHRCVQKSCGFRLDGV